MQAPTHVEVGVSESQTTVPLLTRNDVLVRFSPHQTLPPGYTVQWWEQDEHHHWVLSESIYSDCERDRWAARRGAWNHYRRSA